MITDLLSNISIFEGQKWNWAGKTISLIIALIFIFFCKSLTAKQYGLTSKIATKKASSILLFCIGYTLFRFILYLTITKETKTFHIETILFQSSMPGITEEIIFRGILITLLNLAFPNPKWIFFHVSFGWATVITSILFGYTHGVYFDNSFHVHFDFFVVVRTTFEGFLFALLFEKTKSLIPGSLFHNILNLIGNH